MKWFVVIVTFALGSSLGLTGCGIIQHNREVADRQAQVKADAQACRTGDQNACKVYEVEVSRCASPFAADPICHEW